MGDIYLSILNFKSRYLPRTLTPLSRLKEGYWQSKFLLINRLLFLEFRWFVDYGLIDGGIGTACLHKRRVTHKISINSVRRRISRRRHCRSNVNIAMQFLYAPLASAFVVCSFDNLVAQLIAALLVYVTTHGIHPHW